jgi:hypothetical protein
MISGFTNDYSRLAWTGRSGVHWIVPTLSGVLIGLSYVLNQVGYRLTQRCVHGSLWCLGICGQHLHALHGIVRFPAFYGTNGPQVGFRVGDVLNSLHHCWNDSSSLGVLQMGPESEEQESVFESLKSLKAGTTILSSYLARDTMI